MKLWIILVAHDPQSCIIYAKEPDWNSHSDYWDAPSMADMSACTGYIEKWIGRKMPPWPNLLEVEAPTPKEICIWEPEEKP